MDGDAHDRGNHYDCGTFHRSDGDGKNFGDSDGNCTGGWNGVCISGLNREPGSATTAHGDDLGQLGQHHRGTVGHDHLYMCERKFVHGIRRMVGISLAHDRFANLHADQRGNAYLHADGSECKRHHCQ